jgi:hypothetical protein
MAERSQPQQALKTSFQLNARKCHAESYLANGTDDGEPSLFSDLGQDRSNVSLPQVYG